MKYARKTKTLAKKAYKKVVRPYVKRKGGYNNRMKLYKEVSAIKKMLNAEKKEIRSYITQTGLAVGQTNYLTDNAYWQQDITPIIPQGVADGQRNGDSVKLVSMQIKGIIQQQSATALPVRLRAYVVSIRGTPETPAINNFLVQNPVTLCTDWNSVRNKDRFKNYEVIQTKVFRISNDAYSGQGNTFKDFRIGLKFNNKHLNYLSGSNTISNGQLILYIVADSGNIHPTATNLNIPVLAGYTGVTMSYTCDAWYYDN